MDLATELQKIYDSEINIEISWLWDGGIEVRLGDRMNGYLAEATVRSVADIIVWLQEAIAHFYPDSTTVRKDAGCCGRHATARARGSVALPKAALGIRRLARAKRRATRGGYPCGTRRPRPSYLQHRARPPDRHSPPRAATRRTVRGGVRCGERPARAAPGVKRMRRAGRNRTGRRIGAEPDRCCLSSSAWQSQSFVLGLIAYMRSQYGEEVFGFGLPPHDLNRDDDHRLIKMRLESGPAACETKGDRA
jgi:hypothetical protein